MVSGPNNTGLSTILEVLRDIDGDGLRPNQEHERGVSRSEERRVGKEC